MSTKKRIRYRLSILLILFSFNSSLSAQIPVSIREFKDNLVIYSDLGTTTAPLRLKIQEGSNSFILKYKHNYRVSMGFGFAYRWVSFRFSLPLPGYMRSTDSYGESSIFNIGTDFKVKRFFVDLDIRNIRGYSMHATPESIPTYEKPISREDLSVFNLSAQCWYFQNAHFNITAFKGKTAHFDKRMLTFYGKSGFGLNRLGSNDGLSILPIAVQDSNLTLSESPHFTSVDLFAVPGIAFVDRRNNFQYGIIAGLGFSVQQKSYFNGFENRYFLGIAPKYDFSIVAGYNSENSFLMLTNELDSRLIQFKQLKYSQFIHMIRLTGGFRIKQVKKNRNRKTERVFET